MPRLPVPRTLSEIRKSLKQTFVTSSGVTDLNTGSSVNDFLDAAAISDFRSQGDLLAALNSIDIDRAEGSDLDNIGIGRGIRRPQARASTGSVTLKSVNFTKIATKIYAGTAAPPTGSSTINVSDASSFPANGQVYIGRGSNNVEGPITYNSITPIGNFFRINLATPTTKNHNVNETVVLAQGGNRIVDAGALVQTEANATSPAVSFRTLVNITISDGEDSISNVPVVATELGTRGNVPAGAIKTFASVPFPGAGVINDTDFVSGRDIMSDPDYRLRIKQFEQNKTKGTVLAIETAATDVTSPAPESKTTASAKLKEPSNRGEPGILYIDDNTAYQPIFAGQGFEQVVDNANGGEKFLQLQNEDITKALVVSSFQAPFALTGGTKLEVEIGGVLSEHIFQDSDFATQNAADTFEIVNSINANTLLLFSARAVNNSKQVAIFAKDFMNEDIQVSAPTGPTDVNANDFLGFSENLTYSLRLYKNDVLLIKDGKIPTIFSLPQSEWASMSTGETLVVVTDLADPITYTFTDADFVPFGFSALSQNNSLASWVSVFNNKVSGITASADGNKLKLVSNKGANDLARLEIQFSGSSLAAKMFGISVGSIISQGLTSDYSLNRATAQIELVVPLLAGDIVTAGSKNTRAFVDSTKISTGSVNLPVATGTTAGPKLWVTIDKDAVFIQSTADAASQITITNPSTNLWRFTSSLSTAFVDVLPGDWVIISDNAIHTVDPDFIGAWRVTNVSGAFFEFYMTNSLGTTSGPITLQSSDRITFVRSQGSIQQLNLLTGLQTLTAIANNINAQFQGGFASAVNGTVLRLTSNTYGLNGFVMLAGITSATNALGYTVGSEDTSTVTHTAFAESTTSELTIPTFVHDTIATGTSSIPPINVVTSTDVSRFVNDWISFLNPFGKQSSNKNIYTQAADITGTALTLRPEAKLRDVLAGDRYFPANPFLFEPLDNLVVILDKDSVNKALNIHLGRKGVVNNSQVPNQTQFKAYDADSGPTADYPTQFGNNFDFEDFFLYFKARQILDPSGPNNKMLLNSVKWGPTGESVMFGIAYPNTPASPLTSLVTVDRYTKIKVFLASGSQRLGGAWDSTTQFDVTNPVGSTWRYTYNGIGTAPLFVSGAGVAVNDNVNIALTSDFATNNTGGYIVSAVTDTYFEVTNPFGSAENNIQLNTSTDLIFFPLNPSVNKASDIEAYVDANLSDYMSIDQLESGAGTVQTSTYDDNGGTSEYVKLVDGFNAVSLSNIGTTISPQNQFNLKVPLQLPEADPNYTLVGQEFYIVPSTADQIKRFLNIFAVTGLSSLGNLSVSSDAGKVQIYSSLFGSSGAVQVSGGSANSAEGALIATGLLVNESTILPQVMGIKRSGGNVIVSTLERHGLQVGDVVTISNVDNTTFQGTFTITAVTARTFTYVQAQPTLTVAAPATGAVRVSNVSTITTTTPHGLATGDQFTLSGVTDASFDGTFIVISTPTVNSFTYNQLAADASSGNGSINNVASGDGQVSIPFTRLAINRSNTAGFQSGQWVELVNSTTQQKSLGFNQTTALTISTFNTLTISGGPGTFQTLRTHSGSNTTQMKVEKQGQFILFTWTGTGANPLFTSGLVQEGDWVRITGSFAAVNQGIYKIEKMYGSGSFYLINDNAVEEEVTLSGNTDLRFYSYDSVMPGDMLVLGDNILGPLNQGEYTVAASPFPTSSALVLTPSFQTNISSTVLSTSFTQVQIKERVPYFAYKQIVNVTPDPSNSHGLLIIVDGAVLPGKVNISAGSSIAAISKFSFPTTVQSGEDSYKYYLGLVHEVGRVIRGEADDPIGYPGVAAAGSYIEISPPLPKRIQLSIVIRNRTGVPFATIKSRVQSSVAAYVNSLGVASPVVFSEIVSAVQAINGIQAVSIASPTYNATHDQIVSQFDEKPVIINIAEDIIVSLAS